MAERRMFAKAVIGSARFLTMPPSSRLLYYDLGMAADDDGVAEAFTVMRTTGAVEDDLKVLISKGFVALLNDELVTYITDWAKNNQIRRDRYQPSIYRNLLVKMPVEPLRLTDGKPDGNQRSTQDRIGKDRLGKVSIESTAATTPTRPKRFTPPTLDEVTAYIAERGYGIDPEAFVDYYQARGWKLKGGITVKDWRSCVRTWDKRQKKDAQDDYWAQMARK